LGPISVVYSDGIHKLMQTGAGNSRSSYQSQVNGRPRGPLNVQGVPQHELYARKVM
jgi:hypothetical protein